MYIHVKTLNLKLLIDSGAAISILKPLEFLKNYKLTPENLNVFGINESPITISYSITLPTFLKPQKFYVHNINTPFDGILGLDFLTNNKCALDFEFRCLFVNGEKFPLFSIGDKKHDVYQIVECTKKHNICKTLKVNHLSPSVQNQITQLCLKYSDIFLGKDDPLTFSSKIKHSIRTTSENPIFTKNYRYPHVHKQEVKKQVKNLLDQGIIRDSISPWNSPIWIVPKKLDSNNIQKWRIVIDYRKLNIITIDDKYPIPNVNDILDLLKNSKFFSTIDLASGFHQIQMSAPDIEKTAFSTEQGHFEFTRMPFGLKNAPSTFQRVMNDVFKDLIGKICFIYMDDILVFSNTIEQHLSNLETIFQVLRIHNLKIEPDKCNYLTKEVIFLGHLLTPDGIKPDSNKIKSILNFPTPKNEKELKSFLGLFGYYRKFVKNFAEITKPLNFLLKKSVKFEMLPEMTTCFEKCKQILTSDSVLMYPDFEKTFILTTDASNFALGAVLSQLSEDGKTERPISFASRTLSDAEIKYSTTEKELLSIVWSTNYFRPYLFGVKFQLITDHRPLVWLLNLKDPNSKLSRWRLKLSEYNFEIKHIPGKSNKVADALSRIQINQFEIKGYTNFLRTKKDIVLTNFNHSQEQILDTQNKDIIYIYDDANKNENHFTVIGDTFPTINHSDFDSVLKLSNETKTRNIILVKIKPHQNENNFKVFIALDLQENKTYHVTYIEKYNLYKMLQYLYPKTNFIICKNIVTMPPTEERQQIIFDFHNNPNNFHKGIKETTNKIRQLYKWKNMHKEIAEFITLCPTCQISKIDRKNRTQSLNIKDPPDKPFESLSVDLFYFDNNILLTIIDNLTKFAQAYIVPNKKPQSIIDSLHTYFRIFGISKSIISDQGGEFNNKLIKQFAESIKINWHYTSSEYHSSNGIVERLHATLADSLRCYLIEHNTCDFKDALLIALNSYNSSQHSSTGFSPNSLVFPYKNNIELEQQQKLILDTIKNVKSKQIEKKKAQKEYFDKTKATKMCKKFEVGQKILLKRPRNPNTPKTILCTGPYEILSINEHNKTLEICLDNNVIRKFHFNNAKPFYE